MNQLLEAFTSLDIYSVAALLLAENVMVFVLAVLCGHLLVRLFQHRPVALPPDRLEPMEIVLTVTTILLNTATTLAGWWLWRNGFIQFRTDVGIWAWFDVLVLLLAMDLAMYFLHRIAHIGGIYPLLHKTHHRYDRPRPLTLFVLNPFEAVSFGMLWLLFICVYDASWLGMAIYLTLNVLFGMLGHLGVEPLPPSWRRIPLLNYVSTSTFHAQHHHDKRYNFGFYTLLWDRLFGTLSPDYWKGFGKLPLEQQIAEHKG